MKSTIVIGIKGMHCKSCEKIIEDRVSKLEGIEKVTASFEKENANIIFDSDKISRKRIEEEIHNAEYTVKNSMALKKSTLKQGLIYGLLPHVGCIGFIAASVLGVTVACELFKPLLLNPWFFYILIGISLVFATLSSIIYLNKYGLLSWEGIKRKKGYLAAMYGSTIGISLLFMFVIFPMTANFSTDTVNSGTVALAKENKIAVPALSEITLRVDIPCPGHAVLISSELKKLAGIKSIKFDSPNYFKVGFDATQTSKEEILNIEVFKTYPAKVG
ncbi:MAG: heavy-metal-associated domain-containing protein [archaeon]